MPKPEAFSRVLIDQELRESGWDLLDERRVRFELDGHSGRADYVLSGEGGPLCVLEAKRPDLDPYDAKEQARGYAENLRARAPIPLAGSSTKARGDLSLGAGILLVCLSIV
jgi:type I site-specific restriction endonuclease